MEHKRSGYSEHGGTRVWSTTVTVVSQGAYDGGPFCFGAEYEDGTLNRVIESLVAIRNSIPAEYRDKARCAIGNESNYDSSYATISVSYNRPETPEETVAREEKSRRAEIAAEAKARQEYEALRRRFGSR